MKQEIVGVCVDQGVALTSYLESLLSADLYAPEPRSDISESAVVHAPDLAVTKAPALPLTCFVFNLAGLKLAIPLERVAALLDYAQCTGLPQPPYQLGQLAYNGRMLPVWDIAQVVMPQTSITEPYRHLVVVDGRCAWACHKVDTVIEVMSDAVRWRSERTKRRWLAGMVATPPCALLDADTLFPRPLPADTVA